MPTAQSDAGHEPVEPPTGLARPTAFGSRSALIGRDTGLLILRVFAGLSLALAHGFGKLPPSDGFTEGVAGMGFPLPLLFAWAAGLAESVGGLLLAIGLFTRPAAFFILVNMAVASFLMQAGDSFLERELALLYAAVALLYLLAGPGSISLDAWGRRSRSRS